jgi:hypothetical protein
MPAIIADAAEVRRAAGPDACIGYILRPTHPNLRTAVDVRNAVTQLEALGATGLSFYNYGHLRLGSLDWIAAALN